MPRRGSPSTGRVSPPCSSCTCCGSNSGLCISRSFEDRLAGASSGHSSGTSFAKWPQAVQQTVTPRTPDLRMAPSVSSSPGLTNRLPLREASGLIAPTEDFQERRCLGILHGLCLGGLSRLDLYPILPDPFSGIVHWPSLCLLILDVSVLLYGLDRCSRISHNLWRSIFNVLYGACPWLRIFLG